MTRFRPQSLALLLAAASVTAQAAAIDQPVAVAAPETPPTDERGPPVLFGKKAHVGGYGSVNVAYTRMFGEDGALLGLEGAVLLDHRVSLGIAGFAWTNPQRGPDDDWGRERRYQTAYFGGAFRYSFVSRAPVYVTLGALVGSGAVVLVQDQDDDDSDDVDIDRDDVDVYAVFQPELALNANLTRWLRLGLSAGYRVTAGVDGLGYDESDLDGLVAGVQLQFGSF